ncbi:DNA polymerase I, thermostable [Symmachiella dynata]|uniref:DNA polymerase n=1 Tax=Symmachiella dynata TaxID=2527995 RepID=UPI001189C0BD|nr:DNA polymerase [Symmachiella dynata]QDT50489.1 DNA polymerase I, thermostable [Symmachiella dynata]
MIRTHTTSHDPRKCKAALAGASVAIIDLETTGLLRHDRIVSAGVLVDRDAFLLITDEHCELSSAANRISQEELRDALSPLTTNPKLVAVFHNAAFDVAMLERHLIPVCCAVHDTMKLLKLIDSDRGREIDDGFGTGTHSARFERRYGEALNYKLKDVARHLLDVQSRDFPGPANRLHLDKLVGYLKSDLLVTRELYDHLQQRLSVADRVYNNQLIAPVTPLLVRMAVAGVQADPDFVQAETERLLQLMDSISAQHAQRFGMPLDIGDFHLRGWIYFRKNGLRCKIITTGKKKLPSLRTIDLKALRSLVGGDAQDSLALIHDYKVVRSLMIRLRSLAQHIDHTSHRIHSSFNDFQSSGRVSSTRPNLQQIANEVGGAKGKRLLSDGFNKIIVRSRNAITASLGHQLIAFDIAQADIRVLAHTVESFSQHGERYLAGLQEDRIHRLPQIARYRQRMWRYFQPQNKKKIKCPQCWTYFDDAPGPPGLTVPCPHCNRPLEIPNRGPQFNPRNPCRLADAFRESRGDFYTFAAERMLGRKPESHEREHMKRTILGIVNGMSAKGLAKQLEENESVAAECLAMFGRTYPQVTMFSGLTKYSFAITGESYTLGGRRRRITPHSWMVNKPVVELFISYKGHDKLWLRVVPLRPNRFTLTCWVLRVIDAKYGSPNEGQEIYHHRTGRISQAPYKFFNDKHLVFRLPVRNIPWRLIRRVRTKNEEAAYEGFDKTWRQLFNHVAQGGTADIAKTMMLRAEPVCQQFGARLILQIHDELVFESPARTASEFTRAVRKTLLQPPVDDFHVPIVLTPKAGARFGELRDLKPTELSDFWWIRFIYKLWSWLKRRWETTFPRK